MKRLRRLLETSPMVKAHIWLFFSDRWCYRNYWAVQWRRLKQALIERYLKIWLLELGCDFLLVFWSFWYRSSFVYWFNEVVLRFLANLLSMMHVLLTSIQCFLSHLLCHFMATIRVFIFVKLVILISILGWNILALPCYRIVAVTSDIVSQIGKVTHIILVRVYDASVHRPLFLSSKEAWSRQEKNIWGPSLVVYENRACHFSIYRSVKQ